MAFLALSITVTAQIVIEKGIKGTVTDYQQVPVQIGDSTKVTQIYGQSSGPHYAVVYRSAQGDTAKYIMVTQFFRKYRPVDPPIEDEVNVDVGAMAAQSGTGITNGIVGSIDKTDWIRYDINLIKQRTKVLYEYAMADTQGGGVQFRTGSVTGPIFAEVLLPVTGGWSTFRTIEINITPPYGGPGVTSIYLTFTNSPRTTGSGGNLKSLVFK